MKIYFFLLLTSWLAACNSSQNQNEKKLNDTIAVTTAIPDTPYHKLRITDWNRVKNFGDTMVSHSGFIKMFRSTFDSNSHIMQIICDTIPMMDLKGNKVRDTVLCSVVRPKK